MYNRYSFLLGIATLGSVGACAVEDVGQVEQETAGSGLTAVSLGRSSLSDVEVEVKWRGTSSTMEAAADEKLDIFMQQIDVAPGGQTGWHMHPGPVVVSVTAGTLTYYSANSPCAGEDFSAGSGWIDQKSPVIMQVRNNGTVNAQIRVLYILPHGAPARLDVPAPAGADAC